MCVRVRACVEGEGGRATEGYLSPLLFCVPDPDPNLAFEGQNGAEAATLLSFPCRFSPRTLCSPRHILT